MPGDSPPPRIDFAPESGLPYDYPTGAAGQHQQQQQRPAALAGAGGYQQPPQHLQHQNEWHSSNDDFRAAVDQRYQDALRSHSVDNLNQRTHGFNHQGQQTDSPAAYDQSPVDPDASMMPPKRNAHFRGQALNDEPGHQHQQQQEANYDRKGEDYNDAIYDTTGSGAASTDVSESDFDWDADSDFSDDDNYDHEHVHELERNQLKHAKRLRKVYLACMHLSRPVRLLLSAAVGAGILLTPAVVCWTHFPGSGAQSHVKLWSLWACVTWSAAHGTAFFVDIVPSIIMRMVLYFFGVALESTKTYIEVFIAISIYVNITLDITWSWITMASLRGHYNNFVDMEYLSYVTRALASLFGTSIVLLIEKILVNLVAINFHKTSLKDRLEENTLALRALDKLSVSKSVKPSRRTGGGVMSYFHTPTSRPASRAHSRAGSTDELGHYAPQTHGLPSSVAANGMPDVRAVEARMAAQGKAPINQEKALNQSGGSGASSPRFKDEKPQKKKKRWGRRAHDGRTTPSAVAGSAAATATKIADGLQDALAQATLKDSKLFQRDAMGSRHSARKLARKLFEGLSNERDYLIVDDFHPYFKTEEDAKASFAVFDKDGNGDISRREMREAVQRIYRERKALSTSLKDMSSAVRKLDGIMLVLGLIIVIFIWLLIFDGNATLANLVPFATFILGFSFVFGNSARTIFESMVFIFSVHPYDVGDLVFIDDQPLIVREFGLVSTVFNRVDNFIIIAPNSLLATSKLIHNVRRSGSMWETTNIQVGFETPLEIIHELRASMRAWVAEHNREWGGGMEIHYNTLNNQNYIDMIVAFEHKANFQDWGGRWVRRTKLMKRLKEEMDRLAITYTLPVQPVSFHPTKPNRPPPLEGLRGVYRSGRPQTGQGELPPDALGNAGRTELGPNPGAEDGINLRTDTPQRFDVRAGRGSSRYGGLDPGA